MDTLIVTKQFYSNPDKIVETLLIEMSLKNENLFHVIVNKPGVLNTIFKGMVKRGLFIKKDNYILNRINKESKDILRVLGYITEKINITRLVREFNIIWKGKKGITGTGIPYSVNEPNKNSYLLEKFVVNFPQYSEDTILQATKEFFESLSCNDRHYQYCPKSPTFIMGNDKDSYLEDRCKDVLKREKLGNLDGLGIIEDYYHGHS